MQLSMSELEIPQKYKIYNGSEPKTTKWQQSSHYGIIRLQHYFSCKVSNIF